MDFECEHRPVTRGIEAGYPMSDVQERHTWLQTIETLVDRAL